jgi:hypothetical protein
MELNIANRFLGWVLFAQNSLVQRGKHKVKRVVLEAHTDQADIYLERYFDFGLGSRRVGFPYLLLV